MYVCCPSRLKKTLFAIEANRCSFWQRSEEAKRSVRRTKILSSSLSQFLSWKLKIRRALFQFSTKKDDGNIIILIYHDIKELLLQFSNNEQSPGAHISNKKWVNDIAEATGNIKFARISAHTPSIQILKDTKHKGMPVSRGTYFKQKVGKRHFGSNREYKVCQFLNSYTCNLYIRGYRNRKVSQYLDPGAHTVFP